MTILNILIPMAGAGSRFQQAGYKEPKPFIQIGHKRMIELVVNNLRPTCAHRFIFIAQKQHILVFNGLKFLEELAPGCEIIQIEGLTEGAACTALKAEQLLNSDEPLLIANSDQWLDFDINTFLSQSITYDGYILTMKANDSKWSFVGRDFAGRVDRVVEKQPISDEATCGVYYYKKGSDFVKSAKQMIAANKRHNNEFYIAPAFNELIANGGMVETMDIKGMHGLGTPEDLEIFLKSDVLTKALDLVKVPVAWVNSSK